ncbi:antibiotic biosynthesis monooxygenase family protein [Pseudodesulfovibrio alkaliphilus]|uniref:antibiotic biosynthesis monooxygenase family protein n=1 Tax=Pseudodesulfovibrio alkaliphilus TaxID=2661613 RepID=UPI001E526339|nr:antibiotic biosynthesis monooxygenase [Pseudodesulfovibrio alkaliphilus]
MTDTPPPPYFAVVFTSTRTGFDDGYAATAARMLELARGMEGFLGADSVRDGLGVTVSYWEERGGHPRLARPSRTRQGTPNGTREMV